MAFAAYTLFATLWPKMGPPLFPVDKEGDIRIPDMPSFTLPVSETFKIEENMTYLFKVNIGSNVTLVGRFRETAGMCINFYVLNETNLKRWLTGRRFSAYVSFEENKGSNFTFTTDQGGFTTLSSITGKCSFMRFVSVNS